MFGLGAGELFLIFLIALFFLGPKKLPELAKGLGVAFREFNKAKEHMLEEMNKPADKVKAELAAKEEGPKISVALQGQTSEHANEQDELMPTRDKFENKKNS